VPLLQVIGPACAYVDDGSAAQQATSFRYLDTDWTNLIWVSPPEQRDSIYIVSYTIKGGSLFPEDLYVCRVRNSDGSYSAGGLPALPALPELHAVAGC
jgi:hypothetical protein